MCVIEQFHGATNCPINAIVIQTMCTKIKKCQCSMRLRHVCNDYMNFTWNYIQTKRQGCGTCSQNIQSMVRQREKERETKKMRRKFVQRLLEINGVKCYTNQNKSDQNETTNSNGDNDGDHSIDAKMLFDKSKLNRTRGLKMRTHVQSSNEHRNYCWVDVTKN